MALLICENLLSYFLGILGWVVLGPTLILVYSVWFITCSFIHLVAKMFRPDLLVISRIDASLAFAPSYSDDSFIHLCQLWNVKGELRVEYFRNHFYNVLLATEEDRRNYVNLYCYFVCFLGYTFRKKADNLDLNYDIQETKLKEEETVEGFLGVTHEEENLHGEKKPDWMIKKIPDPINSSTTVLFKLHRGLCDGYTCVHLVGKLSGEYAPYMFKDPPPKFSKLLGCFIQSPYIFGRVWYDLFQYKRNIQFQKRSRMKMVEGGNDREEWLMSFVTLDFKTVKEKQALRRLMIELSMMDSNQKLTKGSRTDHIYIGGWPNHPVITKGSGMGNHASTSIIKGSLTTTTDSLQKLLELDQDFQHGKEIGYPELVYNLLMTTFKLQPSFINRFLVKLDVNGLGAAETCLSTLLCSKNTHFLLGHPVENLYSPVAVTSLFRDTKFVVLTKLPKQTRKVKSQEILDRMAKNYLPIELEELKRQVGTKNYCHCVRPLQVCSGDVELLY